MGGLVGGRPGPGPPGNIGIPPTSGVASAVAPGTYNTAEFDVPSGLAFGGGHLWVTNQAGNSLTEIDPSTGAWMGSFLGARYGFSHPTAIASAGSDLFVANETGSLSEVRASNGAAIRTISGAEVRLPAPGRSGGFRQRRSSCSMPAARPPRRP